MSRRLKVYGGTVIRVSGQHRAIIAAHNAQEVADAINDSAHYVRGYWSVTGNVKEMEAALARPGTLLLQMRRDGPYVPEALPRQAATGVR